MGNIEEIVINLIRRHLGVGKDFEVNSSSTIDDLFLDSLDEIELIMEFEEKFDIVIHDCEAESILSVSDAVKIIFSKVGGNK